MAIKRCKFCNTEMDKRLTQCPNCQRKQNGKLKFFMIGAIAIGVIIGAVFIIQDKVKAINRENVSTANSTLEKPEFGVGEVVEHRKISYTLVSLTESSGSEFGKPTDGNVFLQCEFFIENNSKNDISVQSFFIFEAYCDDFRIRPSAIGLIASLGKPSLNGDVAAGKKLSGEIVYEVPIDWKEIEIYFTPYLQGKEIVFVATK